MITRPISERIGVSKARTYLCAVNAIGSLVIALSVGTVLLSPVEPMALAVAALAALSGLAAMRQRSMSASFALGDAFSLSGLFMYGPQFGATAVALATIVMSSRLGAPPHRLFFSTAAPSLAIWAAGTLVFGVAGLPLPGAATDLVSMLWPGALAVSLFFLFDSSLLAAAIGLHQRTPVRRIWREHLAGGWRGATACGYIGWLVAVFTAVMGPLAVLALLPLPVIAYRVFRASQARTGDQLRHLEEMNTMYASTIEAFASAVDAKDQVTHGHLRRVQAYSLAVAEELGITDTGVLRALEAAALLHDVGKIGIPEHILNKPGKLTAAEFDEMKRHVTIGADILSTVAFPFPVVPIVRHHHENWDGTGYPDGVRGTDIPIGARILMVADCFDALTSDRPYRPAMTDADAFAILRDRRGQMYDPEIVDAFVQIQPMLARALGFDRHDTSGTGAPNPAAVRTPARPVPDALPIAHPDALARLLSDLLTDCLAVIYEIDPAGTALVARAAQGPGAKSVIGHRLPLGHGVSGWVAANRRAIDDTDAALDLLGSLTAPEAGRLGCTSVPVRMGAGEVVVSVYGPRSNASERIATVRGISLYLSSTTASAARPVAVGPAEAMAFAS